MSAAPRSPWSLVSAADYEAHMGAQGADQLAPLATLFGKVYAARRPERLLVLGVATGNGLEHVDPAVTRRTVGLDLNLSYLAVARQRHMRLGASLELVCQDLHRARLPERGFDLVHAALVLEHVDAGDAVARAAGWVAPGGALSVVLQLPDAAPALSPTAAAASLREVAAAMRLVPPQELRAHAAAAGLEERAAYVVPLRSGRRFFVALYERPGAAARTGGAR